MMVFNRNRSQVLTSKFGPSTMSSSPRSPGPEIFVGNKNAYLFSNGGLDGDTLLGDGPDVDHDPLVSEVVGECFCPFGQKLNEMWNEVT